jgi:hypothetical protein
LYLGTYLPLERINPILRQLLTYPSSTYGIPAIFLPDSTVFQVNSKRSSYVFYPYSKRLHNKFARHFTHYNSRMNTKDGIFTIGKRKNFYFFILLNISLISSTNSFNI